MVDNSIKEITDNIKSMVNKTRLDIMSDANI